MNKQALYISVNVIKIHQIVSVCANVNDTKEFSETWHLKM